MFVLRLIFTHLSTWSNALTVSMICVLCTAQLVTAGFSNSSDQACSKRYLSRYPMTRNHGNSSSAQTLDYKDNGQPVINYQRGFTQTPHQKVPHFHLSFIFHKGMTTPARYDSHLAMASAIKLRISVWSSIIPAGFANCSIINSLRMSDEYMH